MPVNLSVVSARSVVNAGIYSHSDAASAVAVMDLEEKLQL